jgi:hypothetical protein
MPLDRFLCIAAMSLPDPAPRKPLHTRTIVCEGFLREDKLFDIEARIVDVKAYAYTEPMRGLRLPGDPVHDMQVRLTVGEDMVVRDVAVDMPSTPYTLCQQAKPNYRGLIGVKIGGGWRRAVQECVGSVKGCTHVRELLFPMATVAFQTIGGFREDGGDPAEQVVRRGERPYFLDGCVGWAVDGPVVAQFHPEFAIAPGTPRPSRR